MDENAAPPIVIDTSKMTLRERIAFFASRGKLNAATAAPKPVVASPSRLALSRIGGSVRSLASSLAASTSHAGGGLRIMPAGAMAAPAPTPASAPADLSDIALVDAVLALTVDEAPAAGTVSPPPPALATAPALPSTPAPLTITVTLETGGSAGVRLVRGASGMAIAALDCAGAASVAGCLIGDVLAFIDDAAVAVGETEEAVCGRLAAARLSDANVILRFMRSSGNDKIRACMST